MTIDERIGFLLQSTESLHSNLASLGDKVDRLGDKVDGIAAAQKQTNQQIDTLVTVIGQLAGIVRIHETRITSLEQQS